MARILCTATVLVALLLIACEARPLTDGKLFKDTAAAPSPAPSAGYASVPNEPIPSEKAAFVNLTALELKAAIAKFTLKSDSAPTATPSPSPSTTNPYVNKDETVQVSPVNTLKDDAVPIDPASVQAAPVYTAATGCNIAATLQATNDVRAAHNAAPLSWDDTLTTYAQAWASQCVFAHSGGPYGENIMMGPGLASCEQSVGYWASEVTQWAPGSNDFNWNAGHFTQLVWEGTTQVGCGLADCGDQGIKVVCSYNSPGNVIGNFAANVF
ncbi:hypothetical protein N2152v2_001624 [Parachlorella kessleri]